MEKALNYSVQEILGYILYRKLEYVYLVEFTMQNIAVGHKRWDWLCYYKKSLHWCMEAGHKSGIT